MNLSKDEVMAMVEEAGFEHKNHLKYRGRYNKCTVLEQFEIDCFERFATLCRADLVAEINENDALRDRLSELLTGTANALKGNPGEDRLHDWSDLPKVAADLVAENENLCTVMMAAAANIIRSLK